jgi:ferrous iron transport protein A
MNSAAPRFPVSLAQAKAGSRFRIVEIEGQPETCHRLREMGFCERAEVQKISGGSCLICKVCGVRMALSQRLAQSVFVEPIPISTV